MTEAAERWAEENGSSTEEVLQELLARSNEEHQGNQHALEQFEPTAHTDKLYPQSTTGITPTSDIWQEGVPLQNAAYKGDVFYTSSRIQPYGHVGIYGDLTWTVEARGKGEHSKLVLGRRNHSPPWSQTGLVPHHPSQARHYAYNQLRGYPYNWYFLQIRNTASRL